MNEIEKRLDQMEPKDALTGRKCLGEGVDPAQMCQSLVDKVAQSRKLSAITEPDSVILF